MTQLYRVLYCSRNRIGGASTVIADEIASILARSRANNAREGVTGGLLFSAGCFAQVLEGPLPAVEAAFERIQGDERHSEITVLQSGPIARRDFPDWSMAFTGAAAEAENDPLGGFALSRAFCGRSEAGDAVLSLMRDVVTREEEWLSKATRVADAA